MRAAAAILACAVVVAGCASQPYAFRADRAERYISRTPGLPAERTEALRAGRVVPGMTEREVDLCMGRPQQTDRIERDGQTLSVWNYVRRDRPRGELERSGMWHRPIPLARVYFGADGTVVAVRLFSPQPGDGGAVDPSRPSPASQDALPVPAPKPPVSASPDVLPAARAAGDGAAAGAGGGFEGWPELTLNGVVLGAGEPCAMINGREVAAGDTIEGVSVLEISAKGVTLQRGGAVRFLQPGSATQP